MATTLFLRDKASLDLTGFDLEKVASLVRGAASVAKVTDTGGPPVQVTDGSGGAFLYWLTDSLKAVTVAGTVTFNIRALESAAQANTGMRVTVERCNSAGTVLSTIIDSSKGTELSTADAAQNWTGTPTSTALSDGDRLKITVWGVAAGGTMPTGRTFTVTYDGPTGGAAGDSFVTFTEAIVPAIFPSAIDSAEAFGTPAIYTGKLLPTAIPSAESVGTPSLLPGGVSIAPSAIASGQAVGTPTVKNDNYIIPADWVLRQVQFDLNSGFDTSPQLFWDRPPKAGSLLIAFLAHRGATSGTTPTGFTEHPNGFLTLTDTVRLWYRIADGTETVVDWGSSIGNAHVKAIVEFTATGSITTQGSGTASGVTNPISTGALTPATHLSAIEVAAASIAVSDAGVASVTPDGDVLELIDVKAAAGSHPLGWLAFRLLFSDGSSSEITGTNSTTGKNYASLSLAFSLPALASIDSEEAFGTPSLVQASSGVAIQPSAIVSAEGLGQPTLIPGAVTIAPTAIDTAESVGTPTLLPGSVAILPSGIATSEALGTPILVRTIAPSAIVSAEAVGTPTLLPGSVVIAPSAIDTAESVGTATLLATAQILPSGIASAESSGTPTLIPGTATIAPSGIVSAEVVGTPTVLPGAVSILPSAVSPGEVLGTPTLKATANILPSAIASGEALGTPSLLPGNVNIVPSAIASGEVVGTPAVLNFQIIRPTAIDTAESFGLPRLMPLHPTAIPSGEAVGTPTLLPTNNILPSGIASAQAVGNPTLLSSDTISPTAIGSAEVVGTPSLIPGSVRIIPTAVPSDQSVSQPVLLPTSTISLTAIASAESLGTPRLVPQATIIPSGIPTGEAVGTPAILGGGFIILPSSIASAEQVVSPSVLPGNASISPTSIGSGEALGTPRIVTGGVVIAPSSVASGESVGTPSLIPGSVNVRPVAIATAELLGLPSLVPSNTIVVESIAGAEALGFPVLVPSTWFIIPSAVDSQEVLGLPELILGHSTWSWVNGNPYWRTTRTLGSDTEDSSVSTKTRGWPETKSSLRTTRRSEGDG